MVRTLTIIGVTLVLFVATALFLAYRATKSVPEFYQTAMMTDSETLKQNSSAMFNETARLVKQSHQIGKWSAIFTDQQINGFLAIDLEKEFTEILPEDIKNPRVVIKENEITLACKYTTASIDTVLTLSLDAYISEPNLLALRIRQANAGSLPLPLNEVMDNITVAAQNLEIPIQWREVEGDPVALLTLSAIYDSSRKELVRLESVDLKDGELHVTGRTVNSFEEFNAAMLKKFITR